MDHYKILDERISRLEAEIKSLRKEEPEEPEFLSMFHTELRVGDKVMDREGNRGIVSAFGKKSVLIEFGVGPIYMLPQSIALCDEAFFLGGRLIPYGLPFKPEGVLLTVYRKEGDHFICKVEDAL